MASILSELAVLSVRVVVLAYDIVTLPVYFILQTPWNRWQKIVWAKPQEDDSKSKGECKPRVRQVIKDDDLMNEVKTVDQMLDLAIALNGNRRCFGTRTILSVDEELQPDGKKFKKYELGDYKWLTYKEVDEKIGKLVQGFLSLGIKPKSNVLIFAETSASWMISAQALLRINVSVVTLYATLGEDGIVHGINETEVVYMITSQDLLPKVKAIIHKCPTVKTIIFIEGFGSPHIDFPPEITVLPLSQVESLATESSSKKITLPRPTPEDVAIIMYTSGSTGPPKGVMLAHRNIVATAKGFADTFPRVKKDDVYMAFLPLAHVFELATECAFMCNGVPMGYSNPQTLTDRSTGIKKGGKGDATILRPTIMAAVPLVLDRIRKGVMEVVGKKPILSQKLFHFGIGYKSFWVKCGFRTPILDSILFSTIQRTVGGRLRNIVCGSAPLSPDTHEFIRLTFSCQLIQGYGLTETAAGATAMIYLDNSVGTVGPPLKTCLVKLVDWLEGSYSAADKPNPRGEVVIGGDVVSLGYYKNPKLTETYFFQDSKGIRWFYTGDIGEFLPNGNLKIIDRKKDLVKLQMGEYISLGKVESELKTCPAVDNICVYGSGLKTYVVALVVPNKSFLLSLGRELKKESLSFKELCEDPEVTARVTSLLRQHGLKARLSKTELPQKVKLCSDEWLPESGLVTAAFKLRRKVIETYYSSAIEQMYKEEANGSVSKST